MARTAGKKRKEVGEQEASSASKKSRAGSQNADVTGSDDRLVEDNVSDQDTQSTRLGDARAHELPSTSMLKSQAFSRGRDEELTSGLILQLAEDIAARTNQLYVSIDDHESLRYQEKSRVQGSDSGGEADMGSLECYMGTLQSQKLRKLTNRSGETLAALLDDEDQPGALFNAGGYIYSLDWLCVESRSNLQYIAVSASLEPEAKTLIGERIVSNRKVASSIQIWSIDEKYKPRLQRIVCCDQGRITALRWVPGGSSGTILGTLAACMQDGSISFITVPFPDSVTGLQTDSAYLQIVPILSLNVGRGVPMTLEWHAGDQLAVGYSDGWLAIWDITSCLRSDSRRARPSIYVRVAFSPISCLAWHPSGREVYVAAYDGVTRCVQLARPLMSTMINHSRDVTYALAYCQATETLVMERPELDEVRSVIFSEGRIQSTTSYSHLGRVRVIATSSHHSLLASGGVDGSVRVADSPLVMQKKKSSSTRKKGIVSIIYRLDRHRGNSTLRMIDNLADVPQTYQTRHAMAASAAWDASISLSALRWNPNKDAKDWLASGTACGLVRIDVV